MKKYFIGMISGTSADAINACLIEQSESEQIKLIDQIQTPYPSSVQTSVKSLLRLENHDLRLMHELDLEIGALFANAAQQLIKKHPNLKISAIGSHGQTIRHEPSRNYTVQIGSGAVIAARCQIQTINDFRRADMARGGQGAPFAPAFHQAVFSSTSQTRAIINIGGIANISYLHQERRPVIGFDCGPGNTLLDQWIQKQLGKEFDKDGGWARSGEVNQCLLDSLLSDEYIDQDIPKSTGPEHFNLKWLEKHLKGVAQPISTVDIQNTLAHYSAASISHNLKKYCPDTEAIYICGGGVYNHYLLELIKAYSGLSVKSTGELGIDPDWVEACLFAWLAAMTLANKKPQLKNITGASEDAIAGCIWPV